MKYLFSFIFIIGVLFTNSQNFEWGNSFNSKTEIKKIIGKSNNKIYSHSTRGKMHYIDIFDENLNIKKSRIITLKSIILDIFLINGELNIINYIHDKDKKEVRLYSNKANEGGITKKDKKLILIIPMEENKLRGEFDFTFSPDKSKLMFHHVMLVNKKTLSKIQIKILDTTFNELVSSNHKFVANKKQREDHTFKFAVSNSGNFYILAGKNFYKGYSFINQKSILFCYDNLGNETTQKKIKFENKHLTSFKLDFIENSSKLIVAGFYMEIPKRKKGKSYSIEWLNGFCSYVISDSDQTELYKKSNEFSKNFYKNYYGKRYARKKEKRDGLNIPILPLPIIKNIVPHSKGQYIISEQFSNSHNSHPLSSAYALTYGQIFVSNIDNNGVVIWTKNIPKNQFYGEAGSRIGDYYSGFNMNNDFTSREVKEKTKFYSFICSSTGDDLKILYLDSYKNIGVKDINDRKNLTSYRRGIPYIMTIKQNGDMDNKLISKRRDGVIIAPKMFFENDNREFIIYGEKKKDKTLSYFSF